MKINRNNYETFFLDHYEGNLSHPDKTELDLFLEINPDLKEEFQHFENVILESSDNEKLENKDHLKKGIITSYNYKTYLIGLVENDLNPQDTLQTERFLEKNPFAKNELEFFKKTKSHPDKTIIYFDKSSLKKIESSLIRSLYYYVSAAASVLLLIGIYLFNNSNLSNEKLAYLDKKTLSKTKTEIIVPENKTESASQQNFNRYNTAIKKNKSQKKPTHKSENTDLVVIEQKSSTCISNRDEAEITIQDFIPQLFSFEKYDNEVIPKPEENYLTLTQLVKRLAKKQLKKIADDEQAINVLLGENKKENIHRNFWDIASLGTKIISKITGKEIKLDKKYNTEGEIASYSLVAGNFEFSQTVGK